MRNPSPIDVARLLHRAIESGLSGPALAPYFVPDAFSITHPNAVSPRGGRSELTRMLAESEAGAGLLSRQTYQVVSAREVGSMAVLQVVWTGVVAVDRGRFHAGQELRAAIAQFIDTRDGRVASIETYDCYDPIA